MEGLLTVAYDPLGKSCFANVPAGWVHRLLQQQQDQHDRPGSITTFCFELRWYLHPPRTIAILDVPPRDVPPTTRPPCCPPRLGKAGHISLAPDHPRAGLRVSEPSRPAFPTGIPTGTAVRSPFPLSFVSWALGNCRQDHVAVVGWSGGASTASAARSAPVAAASARQPVGAIELDPSFARHLGLDPGQRERDPL